MVCVGLNLLIYLSLWVVMLFLSGMCGRMLYR